MSSQAVQLVGLDKVMDNLGVVGMKTLTKAELMSKKIAADMENYAKTNRVWTDRTGNARRSITGSVDSKIGAITIYLAIGVDYGPPLELGHGGRFAIIRPTITEYRKRYLDEYKGIL